MMKAADYEVVGKTINNSNLPPRERLSLVRSLCHALGSANSRFDPQKFVESAGLFLCRDVDGCERIFHSRPSRNFHEGFIHGRRNNGPASSTTI